MSRKRLIARFVLLVVLGLALQARAGEGARWTRASRLEDRSLALEVAVRHYRSRDGEGPLVALVGVVHVGDASYYRALQRHMARYDLVLYESVRPAGAGTPRGDTEEERVESTRRALRFLASLVEAHRVEREALPESIESLVAWTRERDVRLEDFVGACLTDAWAGSVSYVPEGGSFSLTSLGADGRPGGEGAAADLVVGSADEVPPLTRPEGDGLQVILARTLRLAFQLDEIDYSARGWIPSDMAMDEVERAISARGGDPKALSGSLTGSAFTEGLARVVLGIVRLGDLVTGGLVGDAMKAMIIEMLGDETLDPVKDGPLGEAVMRVIIDDRNQHVVDDLDRVLEERPDARSVAIFYGAGHMEDLQARLADRLSCVPVPESETWFPAIRLDLEESGVSQAMVDSLRRSVRARLERMRAREAEKPDEDASGAEGEDGAEGEGD